MVVWIIGMSASGKTTLGQELIGLLRMTGKPWVYIDGDAFRHIAGEDLGHTVEDRRKNAERISRLCAFLDANGINVLACVLSIFHDNQRENRERFSSYREIYLQVSMEQLIKRDNKKLYLRARAGEVKNVVGVDIPFVPPYAPDIVIDNERDGGDFTAMAYDCFQKLGFSEANIYSYDRVDCFQNPQTYQYSRFWGPVFIDTFLDSRRNACEKALKRLEIEDGVLAADALIAQDGTCGASGAPDDITTRIFLLESLRAMGRGGAADQKLVSLLRRFEISKKLFITYRASDMRRSSDVADQYLLYPLFSLVLSRWHAQTPDVRLRMAICNALLKANDIVVSLMDRFAGRYELSLAYHALSQELKIIEALTGEQK